MEGELSPHVTFGDNNVLMIEKMPVKQNEEYRRKDQKENDPRGFFHRTHARSCNGDQTDHPKIKCDQSEYADGDENDRMILKHIAL